MNAVKDSRGSKLIRKTKEPQEVGITKEERNNVLKAIRDHESTLLEEDSITNAINFTWTIIQRAEEEWLAMEETANALTELAESGEAVEEEPEGATNRKRKKAKKPNYFNLLEKVDRHRKNIALLTKFSQLLKDLGTLLEKRENINEKRMQQEYIKITQHSAVLDAYVKCMLIAMMEAGVPGEKKLEVVRRFQKIYQEYPLITEDLQSIHDRLFGTPEQVIDVDYEFVKDSTPDVSPIEAKDLISRRLK